MIESKQKYGCKAALAKLTKNQISMLEGYAYLKAINCVKRNEVGEAAQRSALGGYLNGLRDAGLITPADVAVLRIYFTDNGRKEVEEAIKNGELYIDIDEEVKL